MMESIPAVVPWTCDLVVAGATVPGVMTAVSAAAAGAKVVLVEQTPYLGTEFTAALRPWISGQPDAGTAAELQELFLPTGESADIDLEPAAASGTPVETPLFRGSLRKTLHAELDRHGVTVLLMCTPAGIVESEDGAAGLLVGCKQGLFLLTAPSLVDATWAGDLQRLWAGGDATGTPAGMAHVTMGFAGAKRSGDRVLEAPARLGLADNRVILHPGRNSACGLYAEFAFPAAAAEDRRQARRALAVASRRLATAAARWLIAEVPDFRTAVLTEVGAARIDTEVPQAALPPGLQPAPGQLPQQPGWADLAACRQRCLEAGRRMAVSPGSRALPRLLGVRSGRLRLPLGAFAAAAWDDPPLGLDVRAVVVSDPASVPAADRGDVLVAGGGTAGANAAVAAAESGATTLLVEQQSDLGGTQTVGLVAGYYHGYRGGFTAALDKRVTELGRHIHNGRDGNRRLNKLLHYALAAADGGVHTYAPAVVCGGHVHAAQVRGLLAADADGLFRLEATVTVDATGDGDAAVLCGAASTFGDPRTGNAQDYSQWSQGAGGWQSNALDLDVIDQRRLSEIQRAIRIAHRKGRWFDFAAMPTVRGGRHVAGEYMLTLRDILDGSDFPDTLAVAVTDWDPHGISSSWIGRLGFLPVHTDSIQVRIPWRACIPKGLAGLLLTAKAISATEDAACLCRMAPDVQNLGFAVGLAAARTATCGGDPRRVDVEALVTDLRRLGVVSDDLPGVRPARGPARERVANLAGGDEAALLDVALLDKAVAVPLLQTAFDTPTANRLEIAKAMAWFGLDYGRDLLVPALSDVSRREPQQYADSHPRKEGNPKAGMIDGPDDYWRVNQLLVLLGLARAKAAAAAIADIAERTWAGGPPLRTATPYVKGRIDMQRVPHFDRLLCLAFAAERLADARLVPALDALLDREWVSGYLTRDPDLAGPNYHGALAETALAAAAARCGSTHGARRLAAYLGDVHDILARFALAELRTVSDQDFGRDAAAWLAWLSGVDRLPPKPLPDAPPVF